MPDQVPVRILDSHPCQKRPSPGDYFFNENKPVVLVTHELPKLVLVDLVDAHPWNLVQFDVNPVLGILFRGTNPEFRLLRKLE